MEYSGVGMECLVGYISEVHSLISFATTTLLYMSNSRDRFTRMNAFI